MEHQDIIVYIKFRDSARSVVGKWMSDEIMIKKRHDEVAALYCCCAKQH